MAMPQATANKAAATLQPPPLRLSRVFHARRETVFKAWSTADHIRRWFAPDPCSMPEARVDMRPGGPFEFCMLLPSGVKHWVRGTFVEVTPVSRLVIDMRVTDDAGAALFTAWTEVDFADDLGGTRMDVVQSYTIADASMAAGMIAGASAGWRTTLDQLDKEVMRMVAETRTGGRSVVHAVFHLERTFDAPVGRVWKALTDETAKAKWFAGAPGRWELMERHMDVRVGGTERLKGRWEGGVVSTFDAVYHDVIPNERLVYSYVMHLDDRKISVSLATLQLKPDGGRTTLKVSEHGAFLDGYDDGGSREHGTDFLLDALGASLAE
jgi:uncharacterized protein YndB with AHSA1/START domain